jgi:predicted XRE-type DNA-binding protein
MPFEDEEKPMNKQHLGSTLDDFLEEEGILAETEAIAWKRVIAYQINQLMEEQKLSKAEMARRMQTSRAAVDRLLDPENDSATLITLEKAALVLGKRLQVALV